MLYIYISLVGFTVCFCFVADGKLTPLDFMLRASSSWGQVEGNTVEYNPGLKIVLKAKVNVNNRDVDDKTPLMRVVEHSNIQFARILVSPVVHLLCQTFV